MQESSQNTTTFTEAINKFLNRARKLKARGQNLHLNSYSQNASNDDTQNEYGVVNEGEYSNNGCKDFRDSTAIEDFLVTNRPGRGQTSGCRDSPRFFEKGIIEFTEENEKETLILEKRRLSEECVKLTEGVSNYRDTVSLCQEKLCEQSIQLKDAGIKSRPSGGTSDGATAAEGLANSATSDRLKGQLVKWEKINNHLKKKLEELRFKYSYERFQENSKEIGEPSKEALQSTSNGVLATSENSFEGSTHKGTLSDLLESVIELDTLLKEVLHDQYDHFSNQKVEETRPIIWTGQYRVTNVIELFRSFLSYVKHVIYLLQPETLRCFLYPEKAEEGPSSLEKVKTELSLIELPSDAKHLALRRYSSDGDVSKFNTREIDKHNNYSRLEQLLVENLRELQDRVLRIEDGQTISKLLHTCIEEEKAEIKWLKKSHRNYIIQSDISEEKEHLERKLNTLNQEPEKAIEDKNMLFIARDSLEEGLRGNNIEYTDKLSKERLLEEDLLACKEKVEQLLGEKKLLCETVRYLETAVKELSQKFEESFAEINILLEAKIALEMENLELKKERNFALKEARASIEFQKLLEEKEELVHSQNQQKLHLSALEKKLESSCEQATVLRQELRNASEVVNCLIDNKETAEKRIEGLEVALVARNDCMPMEPYKQLEREFSEINKDNMSVSKIKCCNEKLIKGLKENIREANAERALLLERELALEKDCTRLQEELRYNNLENTILFNLLSNEKQTLIDVYSYLSELLTKNKVLISHKRTFMIFLKNLISGEEHLLSDLLKQDKHARELLTVIDPLPSTEIIKTNPELKDTKSLAFLHRKIINICKNFKQQIEQEKRSTSEVFTGTPQQESLQHYILKISEYNDIIMDSLKLKGTKTVLLKRIVEMLCLYYHEKLKSLKNTQEDLLNQQVSANPNVVHMKVFESLRDTKQQNSLIIAALEEAAIKIKQDITHESEKLSSAETLPLNIAPVSQNEAALITFIATDDSVKPFKVGDRVSVNAENGVLKYVGPTKFQGGIWYGVHLERPVGKNDGSVGNVRYFSCPDDHGLFVRGERLRKTID